MKSAGAGPGERLTPADLDADERRPSPQADIAQTRFSQSNWSVSVMNYTSAAPSPCYYPSTTAAWKKDDARWFRRHPHRSHRVRRAFPSEFDLTTPPGHQLIVFVRQIAPGLRQRQNYFLNRDVSEILDSEYVIHAFFDFISEGIAPTIQQVKELGGNPRGLCSGCPATWP
jgi:hypothetical protein